MNQINTANPAQAKMATLRGALEKSLPNIKAVAASHLNPERVVKVVLGAASRSPFILECTPLSVVKSVLQAAELGLEPGSALGEFWLVPFKNTKTGQYEAQGIPGYRGLIALARRSGEIGMLYAECVFEGDTFEVELGLNPTMRHVPDWASEAQGNPAKLLFVYAVAVFKDGTRQFVVMPRKEVLGIMGRSKAKGSGPWQTDFNEMAKKTAIRRLSKYLPLSAQMARALELQARAEAGDFDSPEVLDGEVVPEGTEPVAPEPSRGAAKLREALKAPEPTPAAQPTPDPAPQQEDPPTAQDGPEIPWGSDDEVPL